MSPSKPALLARLSQRLTVHLASSRSAPDPVGNASDGRQTVVHGWRGWLSRAVLGPRVLGALSGGRGNWRGTVTGLVFLAVAGTLAVSGESQSTINFAAVAMVYAIVTAGVAFLYSYGGLLSVVHGSLWGIGAYFVAILCQNHRWSLLPAMGVAVVGVAIAATVFAALSLRLRGSYFVIVLFAAAEVIEGIMTNWTSVTGGTEGIVISAQASIFGHPIASNQGWYFLGLITLIIVLAVTQFAVASPLGRKMRAIRDNRELAVSVGISVGRVHMYAFALSGAFAALGGAYWAFLEGYVVPSQFSPNAGITFLVVMLLGGSAYMLGSVVGAVVVVFLPSVLNFSPLLSNALIGVVFILVILLSPGGICGFLVGAFRRLVQLTGARQSGIGLVTEADVTPNVDLSDAGATIE
jgi:branched-chain amino acid transport system permease protein